MGLPLSGSCNDREIGRQFWIAVMSVGPTIVGFVRTVAGNGRKGMYNCEWLYKPHLAVRTSTHRRLVLSFRRIALRPEPPAVRK